MGARFVTANFFFVTIDRSPCQCYSRTEVIRLDVLEELMRGEEEPSSAPTATGRWAVYAAKYNHDVHACPCVGCKRYRGEPVRVVPRVKRSRKRGYMWLTDQDDLRVRRAAQKVNMTVAEFARHAVLLRIKQVEETE